jgi:hypothetical protein
VHAEAYENIVDASERPVPKRSLTLDHPVSHQRIARGEGVARILGMGVGLDRLLERHQVGLQGAKAIDEHRAAVGPSSVPLPQVEGENAQRAAARLRAGNVVL